MNFPFGFGQKSSLLLIFFFHGIVFSFLLFRKGIHNSNKASKWLSFLLFLCAMYIAPYMLGYAGWYSIKSTREILYFIPFMQVLLIGPVIYCYTKCLLNPDYKISKKEWFHFIPAILYLLYSLVIFVTDKLILEEFYFYADGRDKDLKKWYQLLGFVSISFYLIKSLIAYQTYKKVIFDTVSYADSILFKWIQNFLFAFLTLIILRIVFFIFNEQWAEFGSHFWYFLSFAFVSFYIGLKGYENTIKSSVFVSQKITNPILIEEEKQTVTSIDIDFWKDKILQLIYDEKVYKNPKLSLSDVAKLLETNTKTISSSINSGFEMNFNDFINHYRIEAVKEKLKNGEHKTSTLLGIALECGFNSKATFNRAFKKSTGISPKDYIQKLSKN
ncbi:helix-turn-helix domain-containing protein [Polaribacter sp.]|uniref:helix-turn-helix domain-containing protein n=1 Tax=Polaribacter sp. TaxID=1920175 RepID=UPI003F6AAFB1